jgi:alpha-glucosidase
VDYGYDVADYCAVHPEYGTLADFDRLVAEAHRRGMRVLVDLVPNHTSDQHPWFIDSRASSHSPRRNWYVWAEPRRDGGPPNNWLSCFARTGSAWMLDERTGQHYLHSYASGQPDLKWWNPEVRAAIESVIRFWLGGASTASASMSYIAWLRTHSFATTHRQSPLPGSTSPTPPSASPTVGEVVVADPERWLRYFGETADELRLLFNFDLLAQPWRADGGDRSSRGASGGRLPAYTVGNHDVSRLATRFGDDAARLAAGADRRVVALNFADRPRPATGLDHLDRCTRRRPPRHRAASRGGGGHRGGQRCRVSASCAISAHSATGPDAARRQGPAYHRESAAARIVHLRN